MKEHGNNLPDTDTMIREIKEMAAKNQYKEQSLKPKDVDLMEHLSNNRVEKDYGEGKGKKY